MLCHKTISIFDTTQYTPFQTPKNNQISLSLSTESTMSTEKYHHQNPTHILVFPFPAQGHMIPLIDLTHQLALRKLAITILVTPKNLPTLTPLLSAHPTTVQALVLPFPAHPGIPAGIENVRDIGNRGNVPTINALGKLQDAIIQWFQSHPTPPAAIVADLFLGWAAGLARRLGVPTVAFSTSNAFYAALIDDAWLRLRAAAGPPPQRVEFPGLPGSPVFDYERMPSLLRLCRESNPETDFVTESVLAGVSSCWRCVYNTFEALEADYLSHLRKKLGQERVYAVGPLNLLGNATRESGNQNCADIAAWLDGCVEDSVLYVCFGSQKLLKRQQMEALALGLERSGVRFIWVVKPGSAEEAAEGSGVVPGGFEARVGGRGLVIRGWAPQVEILGHCAVGGFLSHCGWNSALEGVAAGVRMLAWPMEADQYINARLLVEGIGVAVRVCEGADGVPDPAELINVVAKVMAGDASEKARAKKLRDKAAAAVREGGSSLNELDELVRELRELPKPTCVAK